MSRGFQQNRTKWRTALYADQQGKCCVCHEPMTLLRDYLPGRVPENVATFYRIKPCGEGGTDGRHNLALAHARCNWQRSTAKPIAQPNVS